MDIYAELYDGLKEKNEVSRKNSQVAKIVRKEWLCKAKRCCPAILATICLTISYVYLSAFFSFRMAFSGSFSSSSRVTKRLPMIAPEACSQAA